MPREIFGSVSDPSVRGTRRKWSTVVLSFTAHAVGLMLLVVVPLMATGVLPVPKSGPMVLAVQPIVVPAPPPPIRRDAPQAPANVDAAPVVAPDGIPPEPPLPDSVENGATRYDGVVGGVDTKGIEEFVPPPPAPAPPPEPLHIGGTIKQPSKIHDAVPVYPSAALIPRIEGIVIIEATIGTDGRVQDARVLRTPPFLGQAALDAVRQWVYTPTLLNGAPVPVVMTVTVNFTLQ